jgi:hypothetical protein
MKYYKTIGLLACVLLVISCFLPWAYYADIDKSFSGFFSEQNIYGKPGKVFIFMAIVSAIMIVTNKVWAKRVHILISGINIAYLIKTYILFTGCYATICPQKEYGLYVLIASSVILMISSIFPDMKMSGIEETEE